MAIKKQKTTAKKFTVKFGEFLNKFNLELSINAGFLQANITFYG